MGDETGCFLTLLASPASGLQTPRQVGATPKSMLRQPGSHKCGLTQQDANAV